MSHVEQQTELHPCGIVKRTKLSLVSFCMSVRRAWAVWRQCAEKLK